MTLTSNDRIFAEINEVLGSLEASEWLKNALTAALCRDCVDAAHDAEQLAQLLARRCEFMLGRV
ncbi:hypothetical protein AB4Z46_31505 [Variovorax sp. M-6]|uniref:hypothetical protein n=1 Tax=Variovorax sp. M-6 TaxID=3233041 RepID=UPI003F991539